MTPLFSLYIVHGLLPHHRNSRLGFQDGDDDGWLLDNTRNSGYYSRVSNNLTTSIKLNDKMTRKSKSKAFSVINLNAQHMNGMTHFAVHVRLFETLSETKGVLTWSFIRRHWSWTQSGHGSHITSGTFGTLIRMCWVVSSQIWWGGHEAVWIGSVAMTTVTLEAITEAVGEAGGRRGFGTIQS